MQHTNVLEKKEFNDTAVNKVTFVKGEQIIQDTYYFKAGQVLDWHRHPDGDQVFFVHEGTGHYYTDDGKIEEAVITPGAVVLAAKGVWHKIAAKTALVVSQATKVPAGMEKR